MKVLNKITDPGYAPRTLTSTERFFMRFIRDERDLPFAWLTIRISLTIIPLAVILYLPGLPVALWIAVAVLYHYLNNITFKGPFGLMLHCTSHRMLFKKEHGWLNYYLPWVVAPFFGHSPDTYFTHHIGMHHAENNLEEDESSTMPFQRDSLRDFSKYYLTFLFSGVVRLCAYFSRKRRNKLMLRALKGELLFAGFCVAMSFVNFWATFIVFILPFLIYRLIAMMGNWAQHAFVCAEDPGNAYRNSITCINTDYNVKCWNDGYHISHHERQTMHWTEHPAYFMKTVKQYEEQDSIVFDGIHFLHVFFWLMGKRYDLLARHFVNLGGRYSCEGEVISMLKKRTLKIPAASMKPALSMA